MKESSSKTTYYIAIPESSPTLPCQSCGKPATRIIVKDEKILGGGKKLCNSCTK